MLLCHDQALQFRKSGGKPKKADQHFVAGTGAGIAAFPYQLLV